MIMESAILLIKAYSGFAIKTNEKTTRRWFWCFLVARGGIDQGL